MVEIISVRFKNGGKEYYFNPNGTQFQVGDGVIVETTKGTEYAQCVRGRLWTVCCKTENLLFGME